jgi:hypothetical protein
MAKVVRFSELAVAGVRRLYSEDWRRTSLMQSIAWALRIDPTKNSRSCLHSESGDFLLRGFFAGFEVRVLFEMGDAITVWSITQTAVPIVTE